MLALANLKCRDLLRKDYMKKILLFIFTDFFRQMDDKLKSALNKTLIIQSESGYGKSTLI